VHLWVSTDDLTPGDRFLDDPDAMPEGIRKALDRIEQEREGGAPDG